MPTIIGPSSSSYYRPVDPVLVQLKRAWSDDWETRPDLLAESASTHVAAADLDAAVISRLYGPTKQPYETQIDAKMALNLENAWVRILLVSGRELVPIWTGRIFGEGCDARGNSLGPAGVQRWQCYGPRNLLRRINVHQSYWLVDDEEKLLNWLPPMNGFSPEGGLVGNRDAAENLYGGTAVWTHREYLEYVLERFVDESDTGGPTWTLGGQVDFLGELESALEFTPTITADELLSSLVPISAGVDWKIVCTADGFEVSIFSLSAESCTYGGKTLPRNPSQVVLYTNRSHDNPRTTVSITEDHNYGTIRVLGKRIVVCCSLFGANVEAAQRAGLQSTLLPRWSASLETEYKAGTGAAADLPADHDGARRDPRFAAVYSQFGAPDGWDFLRGHAAPDIYSGGDGLAAVRAGGDAQKIVRQTLPWLPLRRGVDYLQDPPVKLDPNLPDGELHAPLVALRDAAGHWVRAEDAGISVSVPRTDWGVWLHANPAHLLALDHFGAAAKTDWEPAWDYTRMFATIAILTDHRLGLEATRSDARPGDGIKTIECDAEFWYVAEKTVLGSYRQRTVSTDTDDQLRATTKDLITRNDSDRLLAVMAGAQARYWRPRARAEIQIINTLAWGDLTGQILKAVEQGGINRPIEGPITSVDWHWPASGAPYTVIKGGYAL
jgi:hypothetical protein